MPNEPMYTTEAELKKVLSLKPDGYPIPYYPDPERKEAIDVLLWYRFTYMDLIFGVGADDHPFKEDFDAFFEIRLRDRETQQITGGKRWYLEKAALAAIFRGISVLCDKNGMLTGNGMEKAEEGSESLRAED